MANAMVTGVLPWARYIVLTDRLIYELSPEELESVLGHEIGHVKHHHMFFYTLFLLGSLVTLGVLWQACENLLKSTRMDQFLHEQAPFLRDWSWELFAAFPPLVLGGLYLYLVFGFLSRFCERQADIFGCRTVSSQVFISALEKVAVLNGIDREKPGWFSSWRHPTIARRVDFLQQLGGRPRLGKPRFQRRLGIIKWSMGPGDGAAAGDHALVWRSFFGKSPASPRAGGSWFGGSFCTLRRQLACPAKNLVFCHTLIVGLPPIVAFRSAKGRPFAERKATLLHPTIKV